MSSASETGSLSYTTEDVLPRTFGLYLLYVNTADWAKHVAFFTEVLGWEALFNEPGCWAEFHTAGVRLALHAVEEGQTAQPIDTHLNFFVKNVDESLAALEAKGVKITAQPRTVCEGTRSAAFADPFGNVFHLCGR